MAGLVTLIFLPAFRKKGRRLQEFSELMAELYPCFPNDCLPPEIQLLLCFFAFPSESQTHAGLLQTQGISCKFCLFSRSLGMSDFSRHKESHAKHFLSFGKYFLFLMKFNKNQNTSAFKNIRKSLLKKQKRSFVPVHIPRILRKTAMPYKAAAIPAPFCRKRFSTAPRIRPSSNSLAQSKANVEKVVKAPRKPMRKTGAYSENEGHLDLKSTKSAPAANAPAVLIRKIPHGKD